MLISLAGLWRMGDLGCVHLKLSSLSFVGGFVADEGFGVWAKESLNPLFITQQKRGQSASVYVLKKAFLGAFV